ncbi:hypothetical protein B0A55_07788 [Friedmanniomyces simplex]|uniref:Uncharacterized protein n=1 Tax=Friedmanniomyces simplex TaxID=329884 RepID=A0A4U0WX65_9PEZI|nr:hypothetical protein B0A55_07788 [Friedmanniomyces simplex]
MSETKGHAYLYCRSHFDFDFDFILSDNRLTKPTIPQPTSVSKQTKHIMKCLTLTLASMLLWTLANSGPIDDGLRRDPNIELLTRVDDTSEVADDPDTCCLGAILVWRRCCAFTCGVCKRIRCDINEECGPNGPTPRCCTFYSKRDVDGLMSPLPYAVFPLEW